MADTKISALPSGAPAQAGDEYVIARGGANYKLTGTNLLGLVTSTANTFTATQTFGIADVTTLEASNLRALDGTPAATIANSTGVIAVSTKVEYADGTAAAPTVTNTGDTDTGVYFPAANEVAVTTGGTNALSFNSDGIWFRNRLINGNFDIWQRGTSFTLTSGSAYTADRFYVGAASGSVTQQTFTLGQTDVPGNPTYFAKYTISSNSQNYEFLQKIENVRTFAGQTVTFSFYARQPTGTVAISARLVQDFGTGGSPSSLVVTSLGAVSLTSSWQRFTFTAAVPSISGKTLGTNNNSSLWVGFQITNTATGEIDFAQMQIETGSVATPFERRPYGTELMLCQRYCYVSKDDGDGNSLFGYGMCFSATNGNIAIQFPVTMRASPSTLTTAGTFNVWNSTGGAVATTSISLSAVTSQTVGSIAFTTAGSLVAGNITGLYAGATTSQLVISAEL